MVKISYYQDYDASRLEEAEFEAQFGLKMF